MNPVDNPQAFNPSTTQKVTVALRAAGRQDLIDELRDTGVADLWQEHEALQHRVAELEGERAAFLTESGMYKALDARAGRTAIDWSRWAMRAIGAAIISGVVGALAYLARLAFGARP